MLPNAALHDPSRVPLIISRLRSLGMPQVRVARMLGLNPDTISNLRTGKTRADYVTQYALEQILALVEMLPMVRMAGLAPLRKRPPPRNRGLLPHELKKLEQAKATTRDPPA